MALDADELAEIERRKRVLRESVALFVAEMSGEVGECPVPLRLLSAQFNRRVMDLWRLTAGEWIREQPEYLVIRRVDTGASFVFLREFLTIGDDEPVSEAELRRRAAEILGRVSRS